jgi:hypothetical protein
MSFRATIMSAASAGVSLLLCFILVMSCTGRAYCAPHDDDIFWSDCFVGNGLSSNAQVIKIDGDSVYVGGQFLYAGGLEVHWIARWDGAAWHAMGPGFNGGTVGAVYAIETHGGYVYAGGNFEKAGEDRVDNIARWDGSNWSKIGHGIDGTVYAMIVFGGDLYVGGNFTEVDNDPSIQKLARWDGADWHPVAEITGGTYPSIMSMATDGTNLYIGGTFTAVDSVDCLNIAMWDGMEWHPLGGGLQYGNMASPPKVKGLTIKGDELYAAGEFLKEGGTSNYLYHVAMWDGLAWSSLGGLDWVGGSEWDLPWAEDIACTDSLVYVGGCFNRAGGEEISWLAQWNGSEWLPLGSGVNNIVAGLAVKENDLYVGGFFGLAGGKDSDCIALWTKQSVAGPVTIPPQPFVLEQNRPNPFSRTTEITYDLAASCRVRLDVYNVLGQRVATLVNGDQESGDKTVYWNGTNERGLAVSGGVYFYRLKVGRFHQIKKMTLIK